MAAEDAAVVSTLAMALLMQTELIRWYSWYAFAGCARTTHDEAVVPVVCACGTWCWPRPRGVAVRAPATAGRRGSDPRCALGEPNVVVAAPPLGVTAKLEELDVPIGGALLPLAAAEGRGPLGLLMPLPSAGARRTASCSVRGSPRKLQS